MTEIIKSRTTSAPRNISRNAGYNTQHHLPGPNYSNSYSGRIITNLLPSQQGLTLPIVGERVLKTSEELDLEAKQATSPATDINLQSKQLQELVGKVKDSKEYKKIVANNNIPHIPAHTNVLDTNNGVGTETAYDNTKAIHTEPPKVIEDNGNKSLYIEDSVNTQSELKPFTPVIATSDTTNVNTGLNSEMNSNNSTTGLMPTQNIDTTPKIPEVAVDTNTGNLNHTSVNQSTTSNLQMQSTSELKPNTGFHEAPKVQMESSLAVSKPITKEKPKGLFAKLFGKKEVEKTVALTEGIREESHKPNEAKIITNETIIDTPKEEDESAKNVVKEAPLPKGVKPLSMIQNFITGGTKYSNMTPVTQTPNCISGIVFDPKGIALEKKVILIRNEDGETVRAIKTNNLGQFIITSPLTNGVYTISIPNSGEEFNFTQMQIKLEGKVVKPLEFNGS